MNYKNDCRCDHEDVLVNSEFVVCKECGEQLDPLVVLLRSADESKTFRRDTSRMRREIERLQEDFRRQKVDFKRSSEEYRKVLNALSLAKSELAGVNQQLKELTPTLNQLLEEIGD